MLMSVVAVVLTGCRGSTEVKPSTDRSPLSTSRCLGEYVVLSATDPLCESAKSERPRAPGETNPRAVVGKILGIEPGERVEIEVLNGSVDPSTSAPMMIDDVAFGSPTALRPSGLFAVYVGATPVSMIRIVPERHRPVEIVSGADELCVLVELRK